MEKQTHINSCRKGEGHSLSVHIPEAEHITFTLIPESTTESCVLFWLQKKLGNSSLIWVAMQPAEKLEVL